MSPALTKAQQRDKTLDIAKGICIILMVIGHSGCPEYLFNFIYLFHMPCFFFISGWLLKDQYIDDLRTGLIKKAKAAYIPYVKWSLIFIFLHNVFAWIYINESSYSLLMFWKRVAHAVTMTDSEQLLGGYWFLISLFWASVITILYLHITKKNKKLTTINIFRGG
ncbi:acyltransferase family protein [Bacteroides heparinolyticus]|uniref:acyltransferase family protein n=1 Tax=Prevotella heparinolytica TaxID=28113 RepID=UPI003C6C283D